MFFGSILSQSTTFRVQLQALRAEKKVPGDLLGRCPLPSCRPGNCRSTKGWIGWDHDEKGGENHTNHTETRVNIWFNQGHERQLVYIWWGSSASYYLSSCEVCERRSAENAKTNSKRTFLESQKACMLHYCFAQHLLVRGTAWNNFIFYIFLDLLALLCWRFGTRV